MDKLLVMFMIILFAVTMTITTVFDNEGLQKDANDIKTTTSKIIEEANTQMKTGISGGGSED